MRQLCYAIAITLTAGIAAAQATEGMVTPEMGEPPLMYKGLIPGLHTHKDARERLGEPQFEAAWYNYKLHYPAEGRPGLVDAVHVDSNQPDARLASIEAASIPAGYETEKAVVEKLGKPEFTLRMHTWTMLDYASQGLRFSLDAAGNTTGVCYIPHGSRRVPEGERDLIDLRHLRTEPAGGDAVFLDGLQAAAGEVVISPKEQAWLPEPFTIHQDLKFRFVVLRKGGLTVALCGADLFGAGWQDIMAIRKAVAEKGIDHVIFAMSHTHEAGDTIGIYGHYPAQFIAHIKEQTITALTEALDRLEPVTAIRAASRELPMDGTRVMGLIRNARNPGVLDPTMDVVSIDGEGGAPIATIVHFACHPEHVEAGPKEIDADFPGYMCAALQAAGVGGQPIFMNGALGGMVSGDTPERTHESARETGEKFAALAQELMQELKPIGGGTFAVDQRRVELPVTNAAFDEFLLSGLRPSNAGRIITDMTYVKIGELQLITLPGEVLPEVSYEILEKMAGFPRLLTGLTNDQLGYIIPPWDFRKTVYEESMSVGPATAVMVRDTALRMMKALDRE
jgi:hypothetical protein